MNKYRDARLRSGFQICIQRGLKKTVRDRINAIPGVRVFDMVRRIQPITSYEKNQTRFPYGKRVEIPCWLVVGKWEGDIVEIHKQLAQAKLDLALNGDLNAVMPGFVVHLPNGDIFNWREPAGPQLQKLDAHPDWKGPLDDFTV